MCVCVRAKQGETLIQSQKRTGKKKPVFFFNLISSTCLRSSLINVGYKCQVLVFVIDQNSETVCLPVMGP